MNWARILLAVGYFFVGIGFATEIAPIPPVPARPVSLEKFRTNRFRLSRWTSCGHWGNGVLAQPASPRTVEDSYQCALSLVASNGAAAYTALEWAAQRGHGKAQLMLGISWDYGNVHFPLKYGAPTFKDVSRMDWDAHFMSDHSFWTARGRTLSSASILNAPIFNGDAARAALYWYAQAFTNGIAEAQVFMESIEGELHRNRMECLRRWNPSQDRKSALALVRYLMDDTPVHKDNKWACPRFRRSPENLRSGFSCQCQHYRDVGWALQILEDASRAGDGKAQLILALIEEGLPRAGVYARNLEPQEALENLVGKEGCALQWEYEEACGTNDLWIGYVESLYQRSIDLGESSAATQLQRFKNRVSERKERERQSQIREESRRKMELRRKRTEDARRPLFYPGEAKKKFELAGFTLGDSYEPDQRGGQVFYGDTLNRYIFQKQADPPFFGMDKVSGFLSPSSHRLGKLELRTTSFSGRLELISAGRSVLKALSSRYGYRLAPFRFESPDHPYWPSRKTAVWSGPLPSLYAVDPSAWPTGKTIFAFSDTRIGSVAIHVELSVVDHDEYTMGVKLEDLACLADSEAEFQEAFRKKHNGQTWEEWNRETSFKESWYYKFNERRQPFKGQISLAGWTLGAVVDTNNYTGTVFHGRIAGWQADAMLKDSFLDGYTHIGLAVDSSNRVDNIVLKSARTKDVDKALELLKNTKQFFLDCGMDDYYDEKWSSRSEILAHVSPPNKNVWGARSLCSLDWVDKTRSLWVRLNLESEQQNGVTCYVAVYRGKFDSHHEYLWQNCLRAKQKREKERQGGCD